MPASFNKQLKLNLLWKMNKKNYKYTLIENEVKMNENEVKKVTREQNQSKLIYFYLTLIVLCVIYFSNKVQENKLKQNDFLYLNTSPSVEYETIMTTKAIYSSSEAVDRALSGKVLNNVSLEQFEATTSANVDIAMAKTVKNSENLKTVATARNPASTKANVASTEPILSIETASTVISEHLDNKFTTSINDFAVVSSIAENDNTSTVFSMTTTSSFLTAISTPNSFTLTPTQQHIAPQTDNSKTTISRTVVLSTTIATPTPTTSLTTTKSTTLDAQVNKKSNGKTQIFKTIKSSRFFVNTTNCHIPWVDPFTPAIKKMFKAEKWKECSSEKALVSSAFNNKTGRYTLHLNLNEDQMHDIKCCYKQIVRSGSGKNADNDYKLLPCSIFHQNFVIPKHIDAMIVECSSAKKNNKIIQKDAFSFIQWNNSSTSTTDQADLKRMPSVLLIGIDTLSSFNFRRNMPKTLKFLKDNQFFELEGYNKVGDNTFPNLSPLLMGINGTHAYSKCRPKSVGGLDKCDFIWKDFKKHGYTTAFAEDAAALSTYNYHKLGFEKQPTDFYLRPLVLAVEKQLKVVKNHALAFCIGRKHEAEYIYDFGMEFAKRLKEKPKFGMFWTNSFSHNSYSSSSSMDVRMLAYFNEMKNSGILEDSIVFFFSDHGCRWGPLLKLPEGFLEERLPMFFISLPRKFQAKFPDFVKALEINQKRLVTPFDIHQTMQHILKIATRNVSEITPAESCPSAQSIFFEINEQRACKDACIPEHYCTCDPFEVHSTKNPEVKKITNLIVDEINNFLKANNFSAICATLKTKTIAEAHVKIGAQKAGANFETFRIKFTTNPKDAKYEATTMYDTKLDKIKVEISDISRLDSYEPYSKCMDNKIAKKFCICNS